MLGHGATIVRLSFHDAGTFDIKNPMIGGPHAYMRFSNVANFRENRGLALGTTHRHISSTLTKSTSTHTHKCKHHEK